MNPSEMSRVVCLTHPCPCADPQDAGLGSLYPRFHAEAITCSQLLTMAVLEPDALEVLGAQGLGMRMALRDTMLKVARTLLRMCEAEAQ